MTETKSTDLKDLKEKTQKGLNWYPGHIKVALKELQTKWIPVLDVLIQVLDARIPESTIYPEPEIFKGKKLIYFCSKVDLTDSSRFKLIVEQNKKRENFSEVFYANLLENSWRKKLISFLGKASKEQRKALEKKGRYRKIRFGICGFPNVGKSSLLNKISNKKLKTENKAGVTKKASLINFQNFELLDTPGLLPLKMNIEKTKKLQICGLLPLEKVSPQKKIELIEFLFGLITERYSQTDSQELRTVYKKLSKENPEQAETIFLNRYQRGKLGKFCLD